MPISLPEYPKDFPEALIQGYGIDVDMGVVRTGMETGFYKQRRRHNNMPQHFNLTFAIPMNLLHSWQVWANTHGYDYFEMNLTSYKTQNGSCSVHKVRFTSNLVITPLTPTTFNVSVSAEGMLSDKVEIYDDLWILAKTAADPSVDWIIAKTASDLVTDYIVAGTPAKPSART